MQSLRDVLHSIERRNTAPHILRAAIAASNLQRANARLADDLAELFWCKPYLLAEVVAGIAMWPCGYTTAELLAKCKHKQALQFSAASYRSISLVAAERALIRIIDESARLHIDSAPVGTDVYTKGAMAKTEAIQAEMCNILGSIVPGKAGTKLAAQAYGKTAAPMVISAKSLSDLLTRQANDNLSAVEIRYQGKVFKVSGRIGATMPVGNGTYNVGFDSADYNNINSVAVVCGMAKDQTANVLTMRNGEKLTMTGTFGKFMAIERKFILKDCRVN